MGIMQTLGRLIPGRRAFTLANASNGDVQMLLDGMGGQRTSAGVSVSADSAMRLSAVSACVRLIAESIASLPLHIYRRTSDSTRVRVSDGQAYRLLHSEPNRLMTSFTFRETLAAHLLLWGNAYAWMVRNQAGDVTELLPVHPQCVLLFKDSGGDLVYEIRIGTEVRRLSQWDMLHIPGLSFDGIQGMSPIKYAAQSIGLAIAAENYGGTFFGNGSMPSGTISVPGRLNPEQVNTLRNSWYAAYGGLSNANRTAVLFDGAKFDPISIPPDTAQFVETRKFQVADIARWYRVPPHMIGDLDKATFSNIEHQALEFVTHTLRPWLVRFEQEICRKLFPSSTSGQPSDLYAEFNVDGLLRGDIKSRYEAYAIGRQWGWLSANDIRARENMEPIANGEAYLAPLNMVPAGKAGATEPKP
jgi:HK97 family phage portal protein